MSTTTYPMRRESTVAAEGSLTLAVAEIARRRGQFAIFEVEPGDLIYKPSPPKQRAPELPTCSVKPHNVSAAMILTGPTPAIVRHKGEQRGTVRLRKGNWYIAFFEWQATLNGNLEWRRAERRIDGEFGTGPRAQKKAEQAGYDQWVQKANAACKVPQGLATVRQFIEARFQPDHIALLKKGGRIHYRTYLDNHVLPTLGDVPMSDITPQMIQVLIGAKVAAGYSSQTVTHIRNCISGIFRHARNLRFYEGMLPTEGVRLPAMQRAERKALTWDQVRMLADAMPERFRPLIIILAQTGLRIGEACGLLWRNVNLTEEWRIVNGEALPPNCLLVVSNFTRNERTTVKSRLSWRTIPLTSESWVAFTQQWEASPFHGEDQPVFASRVGTPLDAHNISNRWLKEAGRKVGMPWISFHQLRHTCATLSDKAGLTVAERMKVLGHATSQMTARYTHPEIEGVRAAMERMSTTKTIQ